MSFDKFERRLTYGGGQYNYEIATNPFWVSTPATHVLHRSPIQAKIPLGSAVNLTVPGRPPFMVHSR
jgi:hypothetical protein